MELVVMSDVKEHKSAEFIDDQTEWEMAMTQREQEEREWQEALDGLQAMNYDFERGDYRY